MAFAFGHNMDHHTNDRDGCRARDVDRLRRGAAFDVHLSINATRAHGRDGLLCAACTRPRVAARRVLPRRQRDQHRHHELGVVAPTHVEPARVAGHTRGGGSA